MSLALESQVNEIGKDGECGPLQWPEWWVSPTPIQRFLRGTPIVGPENRVHREICRQLRQRGETCLGAWGNDSRRFEAARTTSRIAAKKLNWPNDFFLPDDPFEI